MSLSLADDWEDEGMIEDEDEIDPEAIKPKKIKKPGVPKVRKEHLNVVFIGHVGKLYL